MTKITFEQFLESVDRHYQPFASDLHNYLIDNGCKATIEEKKKGLFISYKHTKSKKVIANFLLGNGEMRVRIYGENAYNYLDFLNTLPNEMVQSIADAGECMRLVYEKCSTKCAGYDVTIYNERYQRCRYGAFEFLVTATSSSFIKSFVENEVVERNKIIS
jgi:hypothetical protein